MTNVMDLHGGFVGVRRTSFPPGPAGSPVSWLSFPRIIDVPFEICVAAMESWHRAPGALRPRVRMRLEVDRWSASSARTALELIPCQRVWPTGAYFRSGHLLLDSLTHSLRQHQPAQPRRGLEVVGQFAEQG